MAKQLRLVPKPEHDPKDLDEHGQPVNRFLNRSRQIDRALNELIGLCRGIQADGVVHPDEARFLAQWIEQNRDVATQGPANQLYARIRAILLDQIVDPDEQEELLDLLHQMTGSDLPIIPDAVSFSTTLPFTLPPPTIHFGDRRFCLTGRFVSGTRRQCKHAILARGGLVQGLPTLMTDYLVIGQIGSRDWIHSTHGRKIEAAIEMCARGRSIAIVSEEHWHSFLSESR